MEGAFASDSRDKVEQVFSEFKARRNALIKALTNDANRLYRRCDPEKNNECLFGYPDGRWKLKEVRAERPEHVSGINFVKDMMQKEEWLSWVANHSQAWLHSVAFFQGSKLGFDRADRKRLDDMIEELPTLSEAVAEIREKKKKQLQKGKNKACEGCGKKELWVCKVSCCRCGEWYHGKCADISSPKADHVVIEKYTCVYCAQLDAYVAYFD